MSDSGSILGDCGPFRQFAMTRIAIRAEYLRKQAKKEAEALADKLRLILALEELVVRLSTETTVSGDDARWIDCATQVSDESIGVGAICANGQLRLQGKPQDAFLPDAPFPDEARVLQVLLRLREIPRLDGSAAVEVIRLALSQSLGPAMAERPEAEEASRPCHCQAKKVTISLRFPWSFHLNGRSNPRPPPPPVSPSPHPPGVAG